MTKAFPGLLQLHMGGVKGFSRLLAELSKEVQSRFAALRPEVICRIYGRTEKRSRIFHYRQTVSESKRASVRQRGEHRDFFHSPLWPILSLSKEIRERRLRRSNLDSESGGLRHSLQVQKGRNNLLIGLNSRNDCHCMPFVTALTGITVRDPDSDANGDHRADCLRPTSGLLGPEPKRFNKQGNADQTESDDDSKQSNEKKSVKAVHAQVVERKERIVA